MIQAFIANRSPNGGESMPAVVYGRRDRVAYITIDRPEVHNALNPQAICELADAWDRYEADDEARAAIITGAGNRAFCSGADLARLIPLVTGARAPEDEWDERIRREPGLASKALLLARDLYKPVIAAVNGHCIAGGLELLQGTDIRVASSAATFALQEVRWGLLPAGGSTVRLPRQVPYCRAMEILLTGDRLDAEEAYRIGLVNAVVPPDRVRERAEDYAQRIADNGPLAVRKIKESALRGLASTPAEAMRIEAECAAVVFASEDAKEGPRAFIEKRAPRFTGR